jgi:hypothetical protein
VPNLKKFDRGILKLLPFKVSGYFIMYSYEKSSNGRIKIDKKHISKRPIFLKFFTHKVSISLNFLMNLQKKLVEDFPCNR